MTAALRFGGQEIAPQDFEAAARRAAGGLERLGVREGDTVCIMLPNGPAFLEAMFGARMLGAYYCPINWHYKSEEAGWMLRDSGAKALFVEPALREQIAAGFPEGLQVLDPEAFVCAAPWSGAERSPGAMMPYTSGTSGRAKGVRRVPLTARELEAAAALAAQVLGIAPGMRALLSAPLYHSAPNSYASTDNIMAYSANYRLRSDYVEKLGLEIFEFKPRPAVLDELFPDHAVFAARATDAGRDEDFFFCVHSKSIVVDGHVSFVGSYNLDPRSAAAHSAAHRAFISLLGLLQGASPRSRITGRARPPRACRSRGTPVALAQQMPWIGRVTVVSGRSAIRGDGSAAAGTDRSVSR